MGESGLAQERSESELVRQSDLLEKSLGYLLHPSIPTYSKDLKLADLGCGGGLVLKELRSKLPTATLHGYDATSDHFPSDLAGIPLFEHHIVEPFAQHVQASYDIVHCRFLGFDVPQPRWRDAIAHSVSLLRPGGYIQWVEPDHIIDATIGHRKDKPAQSLQKLFDFIVRRANDLNWDQETIFAHELKSNLAELVPSVREEIVPCDFMYNDPDIRMSGIQYSLGIFEKALLGYLSFGGKDEELGVGSETEARILLEQVKKEMLDGDGIYRYYWRVVIGRAAS